VLLHSLKLFFWLFVEFDSYKYASNIPVIPVFSQITLGLVDSSISVIVLSEIWCVSVMKFSITSLK
jgi:hypothetical protein